MDSTQIRTTPHQQLYEVDFVEWINQAAELLRQEKLSELDIENLIEEVESLGRSEKNALKSNLSILLMHLLKWHYQADKRSSSWIRTIDEHRERIRLSLESSPSLKTLYLEVIEQRYAVARKQAARETRLNISTFPTECPYTAEQVLDDEFPSMSED
ncbi:MAG: DUF29 domain-containing protein [Thermosynechococcaceae cyanobacterium]